MTVNAFELFKRTYDQWERHTRELMENGPAALVKGMSELVKTGSLGSYFAERWMEGGVIPAMRALFEMDRDVSASLRATLEGKKSPLAHVDEVGQRMRSGGRYDQLIGTLGKELLGSAVFEGEQVLAENAFLRLSYLPPVPGATPPTEAALFHAGGFLPYSDRIFRALPETNLFQPFLDRGMPVYAMDLAGDREALPDAGSVTLEQVIDAIAELSDVAFEHAGGRKMAIEGYCGLGMPMFCYLAARPEDAERKFKVAVSMVAPVDGRQCELLGKMMQLMPEHLLFTQFSLTELHGDYVSGDLLRMSMDVPIGAFFPKTPLGRFVAGWKNKSYADVARIEDLDKFQRRDLAGAYWISPENCRRYAIPSDLMAFSSRLWREGVGPDLVIPASYRGRRLSFRTIVEQTGIQLAGIYGGQDPLIPSTTAHVLRDHLGDRYTLVVHPKAGHIAYCLSSSMWKRDSRHPFDPHPVDLIADLYAR